MVQRAAKRVKLLSVIAKGVTVDLRECCRCEEGGRMGESEIRVSG